MQQRHYVILNEVITATEASIALGVTVQQVRRLCKDGKLLARQDVKGNWLILKASVPTKEETI